MQSILVTTTSTEGLKPLGSAPQRSYELIVSSLDEQAAALLFAEPVSSNFGGTVDWYTSLPGRPRPLAELDEDTQASLLSSLDELVAAVRAEADRVLAANPDDRDNQRLAEALSHALEIPSEDSIYAIITTDGSAHPVLVNWAWVEDRQDVVRGVLSAADTRKTSSAPPVTPVSAHGAGPGKDDVEAMQAHAAARAIDPRLWWWLLGLGWLILALLLAMILLLLIAPCSVRLPFVANHCLVGEAKASEADRYTLTLRDQVEMLERQIAIADRACQPLAERPDFLPPRPAAPLAPIGTDITAPPDPGIEARLDRVGAEIGDLTFSLIWDGPDDLDLEVTCPTGERLFWGTRNACNGSKDIDTGVGAPSLEPVENIFFNAPVAGNYGINVTMPTSRRNGAPQSFQLQIRDNANVQILDGVVSGRDRVWTNSYEFRDQ